MGARSLHPLLRLLAFLLLTGCATPRTTGDWGRDVPLLPTADRLVRAAVEAAAEPYTWVPAAGAAAVALGGWDRPISRWGRDHTPLFGSRTNAEDASDGLRQVAGGGALVAALAVPADPDLAAALAAKARALTVEGAAVVTQSLACRGLKAATGRQRPTGSSRASFPSGHASTAATYAALGRHNLAAAGLEGPAAGALRAGFTLLAAGTAWARVEAGRHYPTDVLVGAALGNFLASVWYRAYLLAPPDSAPPLSVAPTRGGLTVQFAWALP